jgi:hypothetical protein
VRLFPNLRASIIVRLALALLPHIVACFIQERRRMLNTGYAVAVTPWVASESQSHRLEFLRLAEPQREPDLGRAPIRQTQSSKFPVSFFLPLYAVANKSDFR